MREKIYQAISKATKKSGFPKIAFSVEIPQPDFGDWSTNVAFLLSQKLRKDPLEVAGIIVKNLPKELLLNFEKIEIKGRGFINFHLSEEKLKAGVNQTVAGHFGTDIGKNKTVIVDYSAPNIAKSFGVGHLRSTVLGQATYNFHKFLGYKVIGDNHLGDWGTQFGRLIVAMEKWGQNVMKSENPVEEMQKLYVKFHQEAEKHPELEDEARECFKKLEEGDKEIRKIWEEVVNLSLKEFERIYKILGIKFDLQLGESFYEPMLKDLIKDLMAKKIAKESEGALIIEFKNGLPPALLRKSDGSTLYFTRDLAALKYRLEKYHPAKIIYHVGLDQVLHFRQLFAVAKMLGWDKKVKLLYAGHGLIRTKEGKLSTRAGRQIILEDLIKEAIKRAAKLNKEKKIARAVGVGAIKYNDLSQNRTTDIVFDFEKMLNLEGESGPYLQYTYARIQGLFRKSRFKIYDLRFKNFKTEKEKAIARSLIHFPEIVEEAAEKILPNILTAFLYNLASSFNEHYAKTRLIVKGKKETENHLALAKACGLILKSGLELLGIEALEEI